MADINQSSWSETDGSNTTAPPAGWPEGMPANAVNDSARAIMGAIKRWYDHSNATATSGGTANAQTLTYAVAPTALVTGDVFAFFAGATNTSTLTLNVNGLGAKAVQIAGAALAGGEVVSGTIVEVCYDGTAFQIIGGTNNSATILRTSYTAAGSVPVNSRQIITLGGNAFFTLTVGAASGFPAGTEIFIINRDGWTSGRGKVLSFTGQSALNRIIYPGNTAWLVKDDTANAWAIMSPTRQRLPTGSITFYFDSSLGSDTTNASDGLASGASAFAHASILIEHICDYFDFNAGSETDVTIQNAAAGATTDSIHWAPHAIVGAHGSAAITLDLNGGTFTSSNSRSCLELYYAAQLRLKNGTLRSPSGNGCITALWGAVCEVMDSVTFGALASGAGHMIASSGGIINLNNDYSMTIGGAGSYHMQALSGGTILCRATVAATLLADTTFAYFIYNEASYVNISTHTLTLGGHSLNAGAYYRINRGVVVQNASFPLFPTNLGVTAPVDGDTWAAFTPTVTVGAGSLTTTTMAAKYKSNGADIDVQYDFTITDVGTAATSLSFSLPTSGGATGGWVIVGQEVNNRKALTGFVTSGGGTFVISNYDGTAPLSSGLRLILSGKYQAAVPQ